MLPLLGGIYLGWGLGANNAANVFGTAVAARIISFRKAALLCGLAVIVGAVLQGEAGIKTLSGLTDQSRPTLLLVSFAAAITVTLMTIFRLPISTSQAIVGAIAGIGLSTQAMYWGRLAKVVICWVATPIGAMILSLIIYRIVNLFFRKVTMGILTRDKLLFWGLVIFGTYGSYALGANNVANATGIFSGQIDGITNTHLALIGGVSIALGVITYGKRVMLAVGTEILKLNAFTAFITIASTSVTVYIFALIGVPVSASQAIVGAIVGIGFIHGVTNIRFKMLRDIGVGWLLTPVVSLILSAAGYAIFL
jgi:PiT family inorganic phosphate transporter